MNSPNSAPADINLSERLPRALIAQRSRIYLYTDNTRIPADQVIATGLDGVIIRTSPTNVLKVPKRCYIINSDTTRTPIIEDDESMISSETERAVYTRLDGLSGVARCVETSPLGITLEYYANGSLADYIITHAEPPPWSIRQKWIRQMITAVMACHDRHVLVFNIALRNIVLTKELDIRLIDFGNSSLIAVDVDIIDAVGSENGCTVKTDLLHLANAVWSVVRWRHFEIDTAGVWELTWPQLSILEHEMAKHPSIGIEAEEQDYDRIVNGCWKRQYCSVRELLDDVQGQ